MSNADLIRKAKKMHGEAKSLLRTLIALEEIENCYEGQVTITISHETNVLVHKKSDTINLLEGQRDDLLDSIALGLDELQSQSAPEGEPL